MKHSHSILSAGVAALLVTGAFAQTAPRSVQPYPQGVPSTAVTGGGTSSSPQSTPAGGSGYTALQLAQAFRAADANLNGELTRAEATRLSIMPSSFEEMDRNKDGVLSKSEFEVGVK